MIKKILDKRKRRKTLPIHAKCRNCDTDLYGAYCHNCGQYLFTGTTRTFGDLLFQAVANIFSLDNKLWVTSKTLFLYPGKLTNEYVKGRLTSYVHPSKYFWFSAIIFFALLTSQINTDFITNQLKAENINLIKEAKTVSDINSYDNRAKVEKVVALISSFKSFFSTYSPYIAFLMIPFFAFLLFILFRKKVFTMLTTWHLPCIFILLFFYFFHLL